MKRNGKHKQRYGRNQQARFYADGLNKEVARADRRRAQTIKNYSSDRRDMIRGWLRSMSKQDVRMRVVAIYGEDFAASLDFLN